MKNYGPSSLNALDKQYREQRLPSWQQVLQKSISLETRNVLHVALLST